MFRATAIKKDLVSPADRAQPQVPESAEPGTAPTKAVRTPPQASPGSTQETK